MKNKRAQELAGIITEVNYGSTAKPYMIGINRTVVKGLYGPHSEAEVKKWISTWIDEGASIKPEDVIIFKADKSLSKKLWPKK